jgi:DNA-binding HxlR family transcriptional regulator
MLPFAAPASARDAAGTDFLHALGRLGRHRNSAILRALTTGPQRFNEILGTMAEIPEPYVSAALRELDAEGLISRRVEAGPPLRVVYELTAAGMELAPAIQSLGAWAERRAS